VLLLLATVTGAALALAVPSLPSGVARGGLAASTVAKGGSADAGGGRKPA
jgi:hypothetical protein